MRRSKARHGTERDRGRRLATLALTLVLSTTAWAQNQPLPPVPEPAENPMTEAKRALGKMLFFDEQLSSDDSVACATCHVNSAGGTDPRRERHPGADGTFGNADDVFASPGVVSMDAGADYLPDIALSNCVTQAIEDSQVYVAGGLEVLNCSRNEIRSLDPY